MSSDLVIFWLNRQISYLVLLNVEKKKGKQSSVPELRKFPFKTVFWLYL